MFIHYILLILCTVVGSFSVFFQKKFCELVRYDTHAQNCFMLGYVAFSLLLYFILAGGKIFSDKYSIIFGLVCGFLCCVINIMTFLAYNKMSLIELALFQKGSNVLLWIVGIFFFKDDISITGIISAILITFSIIFPAICNKSKLKTRNLTYLIGGIILLAGTIYQALLKLYAILPSSNFSGLNSLSFFINITMILVYCNRAFSHKAKTQSDTKVKPVYYLLILPLAATAIFTNLTSLVVSQVLPISIQIMFSQGMSGAMQFIISQLIFKENVDKATLAAWILSIAAGLISVV